MCGNTCPPSWHNLVHIFEHGSTSCLKTAHSHSTECTLFPDLNICVTVNTYHLVTLSLNMISPEILRSTWIEKNRQQENFHYRGNISKISAHLGPESEKLNLKHKHLVDLHITWVNVLLPPLRYLSWDNTQLPHSSL